MTQQCKLLELSRSSVYYRPVDVSNEDLRLMKAIDEIHLEQPFRGSRRIRDELIDRGVTACINHKVLSWRLSNTMDIHFCIEALEEAIDRYGRPEVFNTDQGVNSPVRDLPTFSNNMKSKLAWTVKVAGLTTYLSNGSGVV